MTVRSLLQTRWKITPGKIIIYPYAAIYLLCILFALVLIFVMGLIINALKDQSEQNFSAIVTVIASVYALIIVMLGLFAGTKVVFDRENKVMYKLLFGLIRTSTIAFHDIVGIIPIRNFRGTFRYYVIPKKTNWWSPGTVISSAMGNETSPHALDFQSRVLPLLKEYLPNAKMNRAAAYKKM